MKTRIFPFAFATTIVLCLAASLHADTYNWNGLATGGATGVSETWDTATANWTGFGTAWPSVSTTNDDAVFAGAVTGTVALTTAVTANSITFSQTINTSYTIGADSTTGVITLDGTTPTVTSAGSASLNSIGAVLSGSAGLTKTGTRTLQLRGASNYTGDTRVLNGYLLIGLSNNRLPIATNLILGDGVTNTNAVFQMNSRSQQVGGLTTAGTGTGNRVINGSGTVTTTFTVANTTDQTFVGILGGTTANDNNYNFTKSAAGRLILTSSNSFTGTTTISGGILELGHATNTLSDTPTAVIGVNVNGGTLDIADKTETIGALTVTSGSITGTTGVLSAPSCAGKAGTVSAILAGTANLSGTTTTWLTKDTTGVLELSAANTFTGNIVVTAGRLTLSNSQALGSRDGTDRKGLSTQFSNPNSPSVWLKGGITLPDYIDIFASSVSGDGGGINNELDENEITGPIYFTTGNAALNISSAAGTLTISGNISMTQTTRTLRLGGASENDNTISGNITETLPNGNPNPAIMPVIKQGVGKWILSGTNTYKGDTTVNGGTLVLTGSQKFYPKSDASANKITGNATGTLTLNGALNIELTDAALAPDSTSWLLVDVDNVAETFDTSFTVAGFTETALDSKIWKKTEGASTYTFTESDGRLVKTAAAASSPFEDWMSLNFPTVIAPDNDADDDPDGDGVNNFAEFAFSGDPESGSDNGLQRYGIENISGTDHLTYTFACRSGATFIGSGPVNACQDGVDYSVRGSLDLSAFTLGVDEVTAITTGLPTAPIGYTYRTFRITAPKSANPKAFIQVKTSPTAP